MDTFTFMFTVKKTVSFDKWLVKLKDIRAKMKILRRLERIQSIGAFGESRPIGEGLSEMVITEGKGYRVYYGIKKKEVVLLLVGGIKPLNRKI